MAKKNPHGVNYLNQEQRHAVLLWLAEGKTVPEINNLAASFEPGFEISHQLAYQYRKDHNIDLEKMRSDRDTLMLNTGLAIRANRVDALIQLALLLEEDLRVKQLTWTDEVKGIGSGDSYERIDFKVFNKAEIQELRGIYDDIARETGGRITKVDVTSLGKQIKGYVTIDPDKWPEPEPKKE